MRILSFNAENVKKLRVVEINPTGDIVQITGANGQGKTSVLDCIWMALKGGKAIPDVPIRRGANKAKIKLDMGELIVTRDFTQKGGSLTVESPDGGRYPSPQKMLDELIGSLSFDPLEFSCQRPADQLETLRTLVPLEEDLDALDRLNGADFALRTEVNRKVKEKRAQIPGYKPGLPATAVDKTALMAEWQAAVQKQAESGQRRSEIWNSINHGESANRTAQLAVKSAEQEVERRRQRLEQARIDLENGEADLKKVRGEHTRISGRLTNAKAALEKWDTEHPAATVATELKARIDEADAINAAIADRTKTKALEVEIGELGPTLKRL